MTETAQFMFRLIRSVLKNESVPSDEAAVDWKWMFSIAEQHNIVSILAYGIRKGGYCLPEPWQAFFKQHLYAHLFMAEQQTQEFTAVFEEFEKQHLDYMPVKGILLRHLYPSPDMRRIADVDVLIRAEDFERYHAVMTKHGYQMECESNHEYVYNKPPFFRIEFHKSLIPSYNDDLYAYYRDGWSMAHRKADTGRYELSDEDHFIYLLTHLAKHYRDGGIGIKSVIDIFLYQTTVSMNQAYVKEQLKRLNLSEFSEHLFDMIQVWFEEKSENEMTRSMTEFILGSGEYGSFENKARAETIRSAPNQDLEKVGKGRYRRMIFPEYKTLKNKYRYLEKMPVLLPVCWVHRWGKGVFGRHFVKFAKQRADSISGRELKSYDEHIRQVGLDIYNGRNKS